MMTSIDPLIIIIITVNLIFYASNVANLGFWRIVPTIALYYRE